MPFSSPWHAAVVRTVRIALLVTGVISIGACDDDGPLRSTARASACDRIVSVRDLASPLDPEVTPQLGPRLLDQLRRMVEDARTSESKVVLDAAQAAQASGMSLAESASNPDQYERQRQQFLDDLDDVEVACRANS